MSSSENRQSFNLAKVSHYMVLHHSFNACHLQIGRVGTYRLVLYLTITVRRKPLDKVYIRTNIIMSPSSRESWHLPAGITFDFNCM